MASVIIEDPSDNQKNKPSGSAFKQQKLPAWQPILTAGTVLPTFFIIGIAFIPIGFGLFMSSSKVQERQLDYTHCLDENGTSCAEKIGDMLGSACNCSLNFTLDQDIPRDVFVYYGLTNYYQNHRRYVKSRDDKQLLGAKEMLSSDCEPFASKEINGTKMPIAPCGAIANSLFNDTFHLLKWDKNRNRFGYVRLVREGIGWATDKKSKFKNPAGETLQKAFDGYTNPPNWKKNVWELGQANNTEDNGYKNEALIVWMRTAALPTFRKLYARVDHTADSEYRTVLEKGVYQVQIEYNYPVTSFKGTKRIIISNTSWLGGKNPFLGVAYVLVGVICLILSGVFFFIHRKFGKSTSELLNITQRTPYLSS
ncbi:CDC50 family protein chat-1 [Halotydeus destructor]|nr:CDC50 family protein chat-1 [Halotydeus destructor]